MTTSHPEPMDSDNRKLPARRSPKGEGGTPETRHQ